jgi:hypothetical protein
MPNATQRSRTGEVLPNPDPSVLTTEAVDRAVDNLSTKVESRFQAMDKAIEVFHDDLVRVPTLLDRSIQALRELEESKIDNVQIQIAEMGKAIVLLQTRNDKIPEFVRDQVGQLKDVHEAKIEGIASVLTERIKSLSDITTQQFTSVASTFAEKDKAVSVGLSAQKESAAAQQASNADAQAKMEANFTALLVQGRDLLSEVRRNTEQQMNTLKENFNGLTSRLDRGEGKTSVSDPATARALEAVAAAVTALRTTSDAHVGAAKGKDDAWKTIGMIGGIAIAALAVVLKYT